MALRFHPYPGFTIATVIMTAILIGLGVWQIERLHWKLDLIATMDRKMHAAPVAVDGAGTAFAHAPQNEYARVSLDGKFDNAKEAYVFTTGPGGVPVYHVLTPFMTNAGHTYLVDRGMVPLDRRDPATRPQGQITGETHVVGIWRTPDAPGLFTPASDAAHRVWYARDLQAIAASDHATLAAPVLIEADATPNPGGWPQGGQTVVDLPNNHLSYAVTWFGLAAGLIGVYFAYHMSRGRLRWT
jgi:surfeit locus 1 family protein